MRRHPIHRIATLTLLALALPGVAFAEPKDDARRHFVQGLEAAKSGGYEVALQHFLAAQEAFPHPATLYNIARTYQDLNDLTNALTYYRLFRDADPTRASDVDPVIAVLEARLRQDVAPVPTASSGGSGGGGSGVAPEVLARLQTLAAEMQAKVDEVNALTEAIASGQAASPGTGEPGTGEPGTGEPGTGEPAEIPELPGGGFLEDAYQRVVVTASRYGQEPLDSPSAVTILTDEDIRLSGATTLADVLRRAVGIDAMSLASGHTDISIRGFNRELNNKVLILVDGRSTYWDFFGTTTWATQPIALEDIERIEIIRGPGSAVYGANAVTGVINIITKTPGEGGNQIHVEGGSMGYAHGTFATSGRVGPTAYRISAGYDQTGRWAAEIDPEATGYEFGVENQDLGLQQFRANARVDRTFGTKGFFSLSGGYSDYMEEFYNVGALGDFFVKSQASVLRADAAYGDVHLRVFWNADNGRTGAWAEPTDWVRTLASTLDTDSVDVELEGSKDFDTGPLGHRLNAGVGYRYKYTDIPGFFPTDVTEHHQSAFLQDQVTAGPLKVVAAIRADRHPRLPLSQTLSPRGAAIVRVAEETSIRVTGGTAFRAPNMIENYMEWVLPGPLDAVYVKDYGDLELDPERIYTAEIGVHDESTPFHTADVGVYVNQLSDIIYLSDLQVAVAPDAPGGPVIDSNPEEGGYLVGTTGWANLDDRYLGTGIEAEVEVFPVDGVDVYANTAIERVLIDSGDGYVAEKSTSLVKINAGAVWRTPYRTDIALHTNYASGQTWGLRDFDANGVIYSEYQSVPAQFIVSGRVGVRPLKDDSLEFALGAWNIPAMLSDDLDPETLLGAAQQHPKGQPVGGKLFGSATWKF